MGRDWRDSDLGWELQNKHEHLAAPAPPPIHRIRTKGHLQSIAMSPLAFKHCQIDYLEAKEIQHNTFNDDNNECLRVFVQTAEGGSWGAGARPV